MLVFFNSTEIKILARIFNPAPFPLVQSCCLWLLFSFNIDFGGGVLMITIWKNRTLVLARIEDMTLIFGTLRGTLNSKPFFSKIVYRD